MICLFFFFVIAPATNETAGLIQRDGADVRYGGVDVVRRTGDVDEYDHLQPADSEQIEQFREIIDRTSRRLVDVVPVGQAYDQKDIGNRPELYRNALKDSATSRDGISGSKSTPRLEPLKSPILDTAISVPSVEIPREEIELIKAATMRLAETIEQIKVPCKYDLVTSLPSS
uniref:Late endosomal/lysosomal adaptor and MAPK and MTOR activator 1 n=1 Tax=Rhodosorus marinus TaxID=101924 RepID=A0A7S3EF99_9RHOD|mmetsp:Transcript_29380/g.113794  ORF Transcript_29380/g.113794 Transcript_29380/m.113794 type:complete len:172 (+) Transcript_29380:48-563(+)